MKEISIRTWLIMKTVILVGIVVVILGSNVIGFRNLAAKDALCVLVILAEIFLEKKREVIDEFSQMALNKANKKSLQIVIFTTLLTLVYSQTIDSSKEILSYLLGGIVVLAFVIKLLIFLIIDKKGINYANN